MTLKISKQEDEQRQLAVTIEVDDKRMRKAMTKASRKHARNLRIPGFRPGKAPYNVVLGYVGKETLQQDALNEILPQVYDETLKEIEVEPYGNPSFDDVEYEPLVIKMTVPLEPIVELGDYRAMRREIEPVEIKDEAVDEALDALVQQQATTEPVERASQLGDDLVISGEGRIPVEATEGDDEEAADEDAGLIFNENHFHARLEEGNVFPNTSFIDELVGLSAEAEKEFTITFPDDFEEDENLAGKTATFKVTVKEVLERSVPELNDEFAAGQPGEAETLDALREETRKRLFEQAENQFKNDLLDETISEMVENIEEMTYPPGAVDAQIDDMVRGLQGQLQQMGMDWETYLNMRGETEASMREEFEEDAASRLENSLVFQKFIEAEKLALQPSELEEKIEERLASYDDEMQGYMRPFLEGEGGNMLRNEIMMDKVHNRVVAILSGEAPDLAELEAAAEEAAAEGDEAEEAVEEVVEAEADDSAEAAPSEDAETEA